MLRSTENKEFQELRVWKCCGEICILVQLLCLRKSRWEVRETGLQVLGDGRQKRMKVLESS